MSNNVFGLTDQVVEEIVSVYPRSIRGALRGVLQGSEVKVASGNSKSIANALNEIGASVASDPANGIGLAEATSVLVETAGAFIISEKAAEIVDSIRAILGGGDAKLGEDVSEAVGRGISGGPVGQSPEAGIDFLRAVFGRAGDASEQKEEKKRLIGGRLGTEPIDPATRQRQFGRDVAGEATRTGRRGRFDRIRDAIASGTAVVGAGGAAAIGAIGATGGLPDGRIPPSFSRPGHPPPINNPSPTPNPPGFKPTPRPTQPTQPTGFPPQPTPTGFPPQPKEPKELKKRFATRPVIIPNVNKQWRPLAQVIDDPNAEMLQQSKMDFLNFNFYDHGRAKNKNNSKDNPLFKHAVSELSHRFKNTFSQKIVEGDKPFVQSTRVKPSREKVQVGKPIFLPDKISKLHREPIMYNEVEEPSYKTTNFYNFLDRDSIFSFETEIF